MTPRFSALTFLATLCLAALPLPAQEDAAPPPRAIPLDLADADAKPDLMLTVTEPSPLSLAQAVFSGNKPAVRIEGDVQLAAEINWLVDHVRWDLEEDLSRVIGDAPAHAVGQAARAVADALRGLVTGVVPGQAGEAAAPTAAPTSAL